MASTVLGVVALGTFALQHTSAVPAAPTGPPVLADVRLARQADDVRTNEIRSDSLSVVAVFEEDDQAAMLLTGVDSAGDPRALTISFYYRDGQWLPHAEIDSPAGSPLAAAIPLHDGRILVSHIDVPPGASVVNHETGEVVLEPKSQDGLVVTDATDSGAHLEVAE